jgi:hypothetical protein
MARRICLSIGVSKVKPRAGDQPGFAVLDGAINAAKCIGTWAGAAGFDDADITVVTDEHGTGDVTVDRVRQAVASLFPNGAEPVDYMVLSFCGHGLTGAEVGSTFWLFSDALAENYRVNVDALITELIKYGVKRITLISDACRDGPANLDLQRLDPRRVLNGPQKQAVKSPQFDRLAACQDGKTAFMVGDRGSALPGKCVFSGVIADILWKREARAIADGAVTTLGLGAVARDRATERAKDYALELYPQCMVDPLPVVLVGAGQELAPEANPQPWPVVGQDQPMGPIDLALVEAIGAKSPMIVLERISSDALFREEMLGANFGKAVPDLDFSRNFSGFPDDAAGSLFDLVKLRSVSVADDVTARVRTAAAQQAEDIIKQLEAKAAAQARERIAAQFRKKGELLSLRYDDTHDANLITLGIGIRAIWGSKDVVIEEAPEFRDSLSFWRIAPGRRRYIIIETHDEFFIPVTLYDRLYATVSPDPRGGYVLAYGSIYGGGVESAFQAISDLAAGTLSPADLDRMAARLRDGKHVDPILGVISAYLYRAIADLDSIRRMAYFYAQYDQAVPYDIALLGEMRITRKRSGRLIAYVPEVRERAEQDTDLPYYVTRETPAERVLVGGCAPWLSIGWDYVTDPAPAWKTLVKGLAKFAPNIMRSGFTSLPGEAGHHFVAMLGLVPIHRG